MDFERKHNSPMLYSIMAELLAATSRWFFDLTRINHNDKSNMSKGVCSKDVRL